LEPLNYFDFYRPLLPEKRIPCFFFYCLLMSFKGRSLYRDKMAANELWQGAASDSISFHVIRFHAIRYQSICASLVDQAKF
jgi:hypothetical protein